MHMEYTTGYSYAPTSLLTHFRIIMGLSLFLSFSLSLSVCGSICLSMALSVFLSLRLVICRLHFGYRFPSRPMVIFSILVCLRLCLSVRLSMTVFLFSQSSLNLFKSVSISSYLSFPVSPVADPGRGKSGHGPHPVWRYTLFPL